eukprot:CAMPEP_0198601748 /NCGR_PEP_ID=MMETSP1462-20131121/149889_1 /TAXON_ID=1333877 /ORGANISM="Brandtodinium nutriculum, Strain RCC3387" /LENGTH=69 /DNA_ID=CAMNT_0044333485 /DNA_START=33 /DNA_END=238 /DNA_ORIENTATION=-
MRINFNTYGYSHMCSGRRQRFMGIVMAHLRRRLALLDLLRDRARCRRVHPNVRQVLQRRHNLHGVAAVL